MESLVQLYCKAGRLSERLRQESIRIIRKPGRLSRADGARFMAILRAMERSDPDLLERLLKEAFNAPVLPTPAPPAQDPRRRTHGRPGQGPDQLRGRDGGRRRGVRSGRRRRGRRDRKERA